MALHPELLDRAGAPLGAASARRTWHWYQFSVRTLLALVFGVALALFALQSLLPFHAQYRAMGDLTSRGGRNYSFGSSPVGPPWLQSLFGPHYFRRVTELRLGDIPFTDVDVPLFYELPYLKVLVLGKAHLSEKSLAALKARRPELQVSQQPIPHVSRSVMTTSHHHSLAGWLLLRVLPVLSIPILMLVVIWRACGRPRWS